MKTGQSNPRPSRRPPGKGKPTEWTFHQALDAVIERARLAGVSRASLRGVYDYPARALRRDVGDIALAALDVKAVQRFVCCALERGYAPSTIKGKHLPMIRRVLRFAGLPDSSTEARSNMRTALRRRGVGGPYFEPDELRDLLLRVACFRANRPTPRHREDLALFRIVAARGLRTGELARVLLERDLDLRRGSISILSKDAAHPRTVHLSEQLLDDVRALAGGRLRGPLVRGGARQMNHCCEAWKLRLREPRLNLRALRRSCATALDEFGAPFAVLRDVLGHVQDSAQTARYLGGATRRRLLELRRLDEHLSRPPQVQAPAG